MNIVHRLEDFTYDGPVVLTQGTFDGVHLGHQKILRRIAETANRIEGKSVLLTFYPHPRLVSYPEDNQLKLITTLDEKARRLKTFGIDYLIVLPFTKEFSRIKPFDFIKLLTNHISIHNFIIGYDHRFGRNREGSITNIMEYANIFNFSVEEIEAQDIDDCNISSSSIRKSLLEGDVRHAKILLGHPFEICGKVVEGRNVGAEMGYPTANIKVTDPYKIIPASGVYAVQVRILGRGDIVHSGMLNLGLRPTFNLEEEVMEVHIFDFTEEIYGQEIEVYFVDRLREEIKFVNVEELKKQLAIDERNARVVLKVI